MKLVITGATGYIGARLVAAASRRGHSVVWATRSRPRGPACWQRFELADAAGFVLPADADALVHLAADTSNSSEGEHLPELEAARQLLDAARRCGAKLVFVSSQTARPCAPTRYGRTKWRIEQLVAAAGGWIVRPGLVYGGCERGLFGQLVRRVRGAPVLPALVPAPTIQPIHVDDFAQALLRIIEADDIAPGVFCLGAPTPVSFTRFLSLIAAVRLRRCRLFLPVPAWLLDFAARVLGARLTCQPAFRALASLRQLRTMESREDIGRLGIVLRPLRAGLHASGNDRRRRLLREGGALLAYVLGESPGSGVTRRYARAIEALRDGAPLAMPEWSLRWPGLLALLDNPRLGARPAWVEFRWRLDAATMLAEATPQGARVFLGLGCAHGALRAWLRIVVALATDIAWRIPRALVSRVLPGVTDAQEGRE